MSISQILVLFIKTKYKQIAFSFNEQDQNLGDGHENLPVNI